LLHNLPKEEDDDDDDDFDDDENSLSGSPSSCLNPQISLRLLCHRKPLWIVCSTLSISCMHHKEEVLHFFFFFSRCSVVKIFGLAVSGAVQM
jgi:hypothetical protein